MVRAALGKELKSKFVYHKKMKTGKNMMLTASFANVGEAVFGALFPHAGTAKRVSIDEAHVGLKPLVKSLRCALQSAPAHTRPSNSLFRAFPPKNEQTPPPPPAQVRLYASATERQSERTSCPGIFCGVAINAAQGPIRAADQ